MFNNFDEHWVFPVPEDVAFPNCQYVHPLQQHEVQKLMDSLYADKNVTLLVIFGSSVELGCSSYSDIDLYIETIEDKAPNIYWQYIEKSIDILSNFQTWNDPISKEIARKGIVLFDRRNVNV